MTQEHDAPNPNESVDIADTLIIEVNGSDEKDTVDSLVNYLEYDIKD